MMIEAEQNSNKEEERKTTEEKKKAQKEYDRSLDMPCDDFVSDRCASY